LDDSLTEIINRLFASNRITSEDEFKWHVVCFFELSSGF